VRIPEALSLPLDRLEIEAAGVTDVLSVGHRRSRRGLPHARLSTPARSAVRLAPVLARFAMGAPIVKLWSGNSVRIYALTAAPETFARVPERIAVLVAGRIMFF